MIQSKAPLLSIIIPTKNRYETLIPVLSTLVSNILDARVEFVVQDNSTNNLDFLKYSNKSIDSRIKYYYSNIEMSIVDNTELAINNSKGRYILFVGDDDIVSPDIMYFVDRMDQENVKCLIYEPAYYWWNSLEFVNTNHYFKPGAFWNPRNINLKFEKENSKQNLQKFVDSGASFFSRLPKLYHGIVHSEIIQKIKVKWGTFLPGSSPDLSFSLSISLLIEEYQYVRFPITAFGASKNSGGGWTVSNKHYGKIEEQKHLPIGISNRWDQKLPFIWSEKTIYAQTAHEVFKNIDKKISINYLNFFASMLAYEPYLFKLIMPKVIKYCRFNVLWYFKIFITFLKKQIGIFRRKYQMRFKKFPYDVYEINNLSLVSKKLSL